MKNLKHVFTVLLLLCTTVVCAENVTIDGIAYSVNAETKQAEVVSNGWGNYSGDIVVPDEIIYNAVTYRVTSIGEDAFSGCSGLTGIEIPNSVTSIGRWAFSGCSGLISIEIPNTVTSIGLQAFAYCSGLTNILIPNSVTSIGENVFNGCSKLESIIVESGNPKYDSRENCNAIIETESNTLVVGCKNTTIPNSVTSIGNRAFFYCSGLTSITMPNSVTSIGAGAFYGCETLVYVKIPEGITIIEEETFCHCESLVSIDIPDNVTRIYGSAFSNCYRLERILIPKAVTRIYDSAFSGCGSLERIVVETGNPQYDSRENCNAIIETSTNTLILGCNNSTIPNGVVTVGDRAFYNCSGLTNITIPSSVTSIGRWAFSGCSGLTSIEIPSSVISIGDRAFCSCGNLINITIPNDVTNVGQSAFDGTPWYNNLSVGVVYIGNVLYAYKGVMPENTSIVVKDGTTMISERAFSYCNELVGIEIPSSVTSIGDEAFSGCSKLESIIVKEGNPKYDSRENCNAIIVTATNTLILGCNNSTVPNGVVTIGEYAFYNCSGLTEIVIPSSVISIDHAAFCMCSNLEIIEMPSVTYIGESAFYGTAWYNNQPDGVVYAGRVLYGYKGEMPSNTSIVVKDGTTMIATEAFSGCKGLVSIEIPNGVTRIGTDAFYDCSNLEIIEIPNSVISLAFAFYGTAWYNNQPDGVVYAGCVLYEYKGKMSENTYIVIKDGTICIAENAFEEGCEQLIGVKIPNSVKYIEEGAFGDTGITSIEIPEGVESLGDMVFANCYALADVVIPSSVKSIGEYAFAYCPALTSIKSYIAAEDLFVPGNDVFYDVDKSKCTLYVPYGTKDVYASTAGWNDFLNICEFAATGIDDVQVEDTVNPNLNVIYDLRGNRLTNTENLERGIYIINGQRVLIK